MDKNDVVKLVVKGAVGLTISAAIGYTYKLGKKLDEVIDERFPSSEEPKQIES